MRISQILSFKFCQSLKSRDYSSYTAADPFIRNSFFQLLIIRQTFGDKISIVQGFDETRITKRDKDDAIIKKGDNRRIHHPQFIIRCSANVVPIANDKKSLSYESIRPSIVTSSLTSSALTKSSEI